ncbi:MAG: hypothetical protein BWY51_00623 [Parcubacteria group bacterium ADurb.Bin316]|nr:MAG: hypothetical protein BWY51_00623 [Parcubacteria group bacterium ADurb.Bin316]HOZ56210.1 Ig-like domain-containing protein [bacterium]
MKSLVKNRIGLTAFLVAAVLLFSFFSALTVWGQTDLGLNEAGAIGLPSSDGRDIKTLLVDIVKYLLSFLGMVAVVIIMYAGWLWMTSGGNQYQLEKAKKTLINATIGLIIIVLSFMIVAWVSNWITSTINYRGSSSRGSSSGVGLATAGNTAIESHYPARDQRDVPRNTRIVVTFREPIRVEDIIEAGRVNTDNVKIFKTVEDNTRLHSPNLTAVTTDGRTFRFAQEEPFMGSPSENFWYTVELTSNIYKANGDRLFSIGGGYSWQFELSTAIDNEPPKIASFIPRINAIEPRNVVIQINFNEAIDPITAMGEAPAFDNIQVNSGSMLAGEFYISNQYRTVEFLTTDQCGVNSCGHPVYCLPADSNIRTTVLAATLDNPGSGSAYSSAIDGIVDMAGNSLDGNNNNIAEGPTSQNGLPAYDANNPTVASTSDNFSWLFSTNNNVDITEPRINSINPNASYNDTNVDVREIPFAVFNKLILSSSLKKIETISLRANPTASEVFYWLTSANEPAVNPNQTRVFLNHRQFVNTVNSTYAPLFTSGILDIYQNCFYPSGGLSCTASPGTGFPYCCNGALATDCDP